MDLLWLHLLHYAMSMSPYSCCSKFRRLERHSEKIFASATPIIRVHFPHEKEWKLCSVVPTLFWVASLDHLIRAPHQSWGSPMVITVCLSEKTCLYISSLTTTQISVKLGMHGTLNINHFLAKCYLLKFTRLLWNKAYL